LNTLETERTELENDIAFKEFQRETLLELIGINPFRAEYPEMSDPAPGASNTPNPTQRVQKNAPSRGPLATFRATPGSQPFAEDETSNTNRLILTAIHAAAPAGYLPPTDLKWDTDRGPVVIDQAEDKIKKLEELLTNPAFQTPWLCVGRKKEVPRCACYVGHSCDCHGESHVWVMPEHAEILKEFTLIILTFAPPEKTEFPPSASFSPVLAR